MKKEYILFIDSGVGGLSTLSETYKILPTNFIYYADNANSPYGTHSKAEIFSYIKSIITNCLKNFNIKIVVLACNTATTSSLKLLRTEFNNLTFIGTEPAIKLATDSGFKKILCISTPATAKQKKYHELRNKLLCSGVSITSHGLCDFAKNIDDYFSADSLSAKFYLLKNLFEIKKLSENYDSIVLGCTHYCLVQDDIFAMTKKPVINGNAGVAQQVFEMHKKNCHDSFSKISSKKMSVKFMFSESSNDLKQKYVKIFKQILAK
jgi:glutamate racemase